MQTIYIDISSKGVVPTIYAKQGDIGRKFEVIFTNSGLPYTIPADSVFSVWYSGESGEGNYTNIGDNSAFYVNENKVTVELITQMLTNDGNGILCIVLNESNGNQIGSWNIPYLCEKVPGIESEAAKEYYTAFSKSVEGLKQITENLTPEAIGAHPDTWLPTIEEIGAAPAGFGLGRSAVSIPSSDNLNNYKVGGWYQFTKGVANAPFDYGMMLVIHGVNYDNDTFQYAFSRYPENNMALRQLLEGSWGEWEWINPPMAIGVEYRTTERYKGKPVYARIIDFGKLPNATTKTYYDLSLGVDNLVFAEFTIDKGDSRAIDWSSGEIKWYIGCYNNPYLEVKCTTDKSAYNGYLLFKFTKKED